MISVDRRHFKEKVDGNRNGFWQKTLGLGYGEKKFVTMII